MNSPAASISLMVVGVLVLFFGAQALSTGPDDIDAARDMAASKRDAVNEARRQAEDFKRIKAHTEAMAWSKCKDLYGHAAQVYEIRGTADFVCRRLPGVM